MAERPKAEYHSTQLELYAVLRIGLSSFREFLPDFSNFKAFYDAAWGNDFEQEIEDAAALPDFQARDEASESALIILDKKRKECANKWQDLKRYITSTTGWEDLQKPKQEAAGSTIYEKAAGGNWEVLKGLMITASSFITNNEAALEADGNMPNGFKGQFNTLKDDYCDLYDDFTDKTQDQEQETDEKVEDNNVIFNKGSDMFADGQAIFRDDASVADRFTFDQILKIVRGSRGVTRTFAIAADTRELVERVVANSDITNTGAVELLLESGNVPAPSPGAITIPVDGSVTRPEGESTISVFNQSPETAGEFTARVTID